MSERNGEQKCFCSLEQLTQGKCVSNPEKQKVPLAMIRAAEKFIKSQVKASMTDEEIDDATDIALDRWQTWTGHAYNAALARLGLIEDES